MAGDRMRCVAEVERLFGSRYQIYRTREGGLMVARDVGGLIMSVGLSVKGGYGALLAKLHEHEVDQRRHEAHAWVHAAFEAAVQGFDVREPCRQVQGWIEHGSEEP